MTNTMPPPNTYRRIDIDIAKCIGIFLVVMGHSGIPTSISMWIYSFHMPLFFYISGYLFQTDKYDLASFLCRKWKTILIPYLFFLLYNWTLYNVIHNPYYPPYSFWNVIQNGTDDPTWFLYVLFFTEIFHFVIDRYTLKNNIVKRKTVTIIALTSLILGYLLSIHDIHLPYKLENIPFSYFFYALGCLHVTDKINVNFYTIMLIWITQFISSIFLCGKIDMNYNNIGNFPISILVAILGIVCCVKFSSLNIFNVHFYKLLSFGGRNTLAILCLHFGFMNMLQVIFAQISISTIGSMVVRQILLWGLLYISIIIINKYIPWIVGKS